MISRRVIPTTVVWIGLVVSLFTHTAYLFVDHDQYGPDTFSYLIPAENMLHGFGFVNALHQPELRRTPGYPLLLWAFLVERIPLGYLVLVQHLLCVLLVLGLTVVTARLAENNLAALAAALALSLDFATIRIANLLLTEIAATVLIALLAWTLYCATKGGPTTVLLIGTGFLGGCAALLRPAALLYCIPLVLYLVLVLRRRAFRYISALLISFVILPALWTLRNYHDAHYLGLTTIGAEDIFFYRAAGALATKMPGYYPDNLHHMREVLIAQACVNLELQSGRACDDVPDTQKTSYFTRKGTEIIIGNPLSYLHSASVGLAYTVFGGGTEAVSRLMNVNFHSAEAIVLLFTIPEACLAIAGCRFWYRRDRHLAYLLMLTVGYFLIISAGAEAYSRFRVPVMPMYAMLIGGGTVEIGHALRRFRAQYKVFRESARGPIVAPPVIGRLGSGAFEDTRTPSDATIALTSPHPSRCRVC